MLSSYRIMWIFVFFDLPTNTKTEQKRASKFRKYLLKDSFGMMQYSIYIRHCASKEISNLHINRIRKNLPKNGHISILTITDKQFGNIINLWDGSSEPPKQLPAPQLELF